MTRSATYRQQVEQFRAELDVLINTPPKKSGRLYIDSTGDRSRAAPSKSMEEKMLYYGSQRFESVARVLSIFEILKNTETLYDRKNSVTPTSAKAVWQAFGGTLENNACHTCPTYLQLNGHLPTMMTSNSGLQRFIIIEFADCILMPRSINEIDRVFDEIAGKSAFIDAAYVVLNERGAGWEQGIDIFREEVRDFLGPARDILFDTSRKSYVACNEADQVRINMMSAYYEGLFLHPLNSNSIKALIQQVTKEVGCEGPQDSATPKK